jgi:hypothetical protein
MRKIIGLICVAIFLAFPALADPLVIAASGRGPSEIAAIASAKRQAATDALSAGFLPRDGYRISGTRVIDVTRVGTAYVARVDASLIKDLESKRVVFVVSSEESQAPRLLALIQRVRTVLAEQRSGNQPHIEVIDSLATGTLRIRGLSDIQRPGLNVELDQMAAAQRADSMYLLSASSDTSLIFLVTAWGDGGSSKTIRTLRDVATGDNLPLSAQIAEVVRNDVGRITGGGDIHSVITLPAAGATVRKGQSVIIYADKSEDGGVRESSIVTHGIVTEVSGSKVRVLTAQPVSTSPSIKLRLSPLPKRGVIITESDW